MAEKKKAAAKAAVPTKADAPASSSKLRPGTGTKRNKTRFIVIYGQPKTRKTTSCANLPLGRTKWIASDSNCVATLDALGRLPHNDDIYEVSSLNDAINLTNEMLDLCEKEGGDALGIDFLVLDSFTQFSDWHQQDIAKETSQRYLGEQAGMGWQQFNAEFGKLLDNLAMLTRYVTVIGIGHMKESAFKKKGTNATLSLPPQMAEKLARLANWILFKTFEEKFEVADGFEGDEYISVEEVRGEKRYFESILHTRPSGNVIATVNSFKLLAEEPGDLVKLLEKDGLL